MWLEALDIQSRYLELNVRKKISKYHCKLISSSSSLCCHMFDEIIWFHFSNFALSRSQHSIIWIFMIIFSYHFSFTLLYFNRNSWSWIFVLQHLIRVRDEVSILDLRHHERFNSSIHPLDSPGSKDSGVWRYCIPYSSFVYEISIFVMISSYSRSSMTCTNFDDSCKCILLFLEVVNMQNIHDRQPRAPRAETICFLFC